MASQIQQKVENPRCDAFSESRGYAHRFRCKRKSHIGSDRMLLTTRRRSENKDKGHRAISALLQNDTLFCVSTFVIGLCKMKPYRDRLEGQAIFDDTSSCGDQAKKPGRENVHRSSQFIFHGRENESVNLYRLNLASTNKFRGSWSLA